MFDYVQKSHLQDCVQYFSAAELSALLTPNVEPSKAAYVIEFGWLRDLEGLRKAVRQPRRLKRLLGHVASGCDIGFQ